MFFLIPKGNPLHEILRLPLYWWQIKREKAALPIGEKRKYGKHKHQYYLLFPAPSMAKDTVRILVYFHGGAWRYGRPELFQLVAERFTNLGYTTILPSCRRTPTYNYSHVREDLSAILGQVQTEFSDQQVRYIVGGMSSGGNLAAHLFYNISALQEVGIQAAQLQGLLLLGAPLSLQGMPNSIHVSSFAGKAGSKLYKEARIEAHVQESDLRPVLCIHGECDGLVPIASARQFFAQLKDQQQEKVLRVHPTDATHLDVASWVRQSSPFQQIIFDWLKTLD